MYCKKCGAKLEDGAKFCSQCGTVVNNTSETKANTKENPYSLNMNIISWVLIVLLALMFLGSLPSISSIIFLSCIVIMLPINQFARFFPKFYLRVLISVVLAFVAILIYPTCDHEYTVIENIEPTCTEEGRVVQQCILCEKDDTENLKALGHLWKTATEVKAECDSAGYVIEKCDRCSETQKIETDVALGHDMKEISRIEATDDKDGMIDYKCIRCGINKSETIKNSNPKGSEGNPYVLNADKWYSDHCSGTSQNKYRDKWVKTSGIVLTISDYGGLKGYYLAGGQGSGLVCWVYSDDIDAQYGQYVEYIGRVSVEDSKHIEITDGKIVAAQWPSEKIKSPVTISEWTWSRNSVGGVKWNFKFTNNTDKTVKYITMEWNCYNAVGDLVYDQITGKSSHSVKYTGPLEPGITTTSFSNTSLFYSYSYNSSKLTRLQVEFMDGTVIRITGQAYKDIVVEKLDWREMLSPKLVSEVEAAFSEIGERSDIIINIEYVDKHIFADTFERKCYKIELLAETPTNPNHFRYSRYYLLEIQTYYESTPEKAQYPDEFLYAISFWNSNGDHTAATKQWTFTGDGNKQKIN